MLVRWLSADVGSLAFCDNSQSLMSHEIVDLAGYVVVRRQSGPGQHLPGL